VSPGSLPVASWALAAAIVVIFCAASPECRGGAFRLARRWRAGEPSAAWFALAVVGSAVAGGAISWLAR
jgi:hypothetical protein